ncbi:MAG: hypothetical protein HY773_02560 [Candidatus Terrybacteria bacterium]|nr:hypothetical protein [Candidatus Terrybacteria bacterium]
MKLKTQNTGFTLLLSLLVISIVLVTGLSISGVIMKEIMLSGLGRESQIAFYAADTGLECAFYWDVKKVFNSTIYSIECAGKSISGEMEIIPGISTTTSFTVNLSNGACAKIKVDKSNPPFTTVESRGYNIDCDFLGPRKVERGLGGRLKHG